MWHADCYTSFVMNERKHPTPQKLPPLRRHDRPGHLDPGHVARLLAFSRARQEQPDDSGFLEASAAEDDFASELGQTTVASMNGGDATLAGDLDGPFDEEVGGPFLVTPTNDELAEDIDLSDLDVPRPSELPRAKQIAGWLGRHLAAGATRLARVRRRRAG